MQLLMQVGSPFGAIGHIINDASISDKFSCAALACVAAQFGFCDDGIWDVHAGDYTGYGGEIKKNLLSHRRFVSAMFRVIF
jgi:hypothetical protein